MANSARGARVIDGYFNFIRGRDVNNGLAYTVLGSRGACPIRLGSNFNSF